MNNKQFALLCSAAIGAAATMASVFGFAVETFADRQPIVFLAAVITVTLIVSIGIARSYAGAFAVAPSVGWHTLSARFVVGVIVSYPVLAICYGVVAALFMAARGSMDERDADLALFLIAMWLPLATVPLSAAVVAWWWSSHATLRTRSAA